MIHLPYMGTQTLTGEMTSWIVVLSLVGYSSCMEVQSAGNHANNEHQHYHSVEAEYMATTQACKEAMWWRYFLTELGLPPKGPTVIYSDSQGSMALAKNPEHHERTKHIDIQYHFIRH